MSVVPPYATALRTAMYYNVNSNPKRKGLIMKFLSFFLCVLLISFTATAGSFTISASAGTMPVIIIGGVKCKGVSVNPTKPIIVLSSTANQAKCNFPAGLEIYGPSGVGAILIRSTGIAVTACVNITQTNENIVINSVGGEGCALPPSQQLLKLQKSVR